MQVKTRARLAPWGAPRVLTVLRALADQACHHPLRQAHRRQAEQGRSSCRVGHRGECQAVDD